MYLRRHIPHIGPLPNGLPVILRQPVAVVIDLVPLCPRTHRFKITTYMARIKVDERLRIRTVNPDGTKHANVDVAHEALADKVDAVG